MPAENGEELGFRATLLIPRPRGFRIIPHPFRSLYWKQTPLSGIPVWEWRVVTWAMPIRKHQFAPMRGRWRLSHHKGRAISRFSLLLGCLAFVSILLLVPHFLWRPQPSALLQPGSPKLRIPGSTVALSRTLPLLRPDVVVLPNGALSSCIWPTPFCNFYVDFTEIIWQFLFNFNTLLNSLILYSFKSPVEFFQYCATSVLSWTLQFLHYFNPFLNPSNFVQLQFSLELFNFCTASVLSSSWILLQCQLCLELFNFSTASILVQLQFSLDFFNSCTIQILRAIWRQICLTQARPIFSKRQRNAKDERQ